MNKKEKLIEFANDVLKTLEQNEEWNADVVDFIAEIAMDLNLAKLDEENMFKIKK